MSHYLTTQVCDHTTTCYYDPDPEKSECDGFVAHEFTIECDGGEDDDCRWKCSGDCTQWEIEWTPQVGRTCSECGHAMDPQSCGVITYFENTGQPLEEIVDWETPKLGRHLVEVEYEEGYRVSYPVDAVVKP